MRAVAWHNRIVRSDAARAFSKRALAPFETYRRAIVFDNLRPQSGSANVEAEPLANQVTDSMRYGGAPPR